MGADTDDDGRFSIQVPAGRYRVRVQQIGCEPIHTEIVLSEGGSESLRVALICPRLHCLKLGKARLTPECFRADREERAFVGRACPVHSGTALACDTVPISHGLMVTTRVHVQAERDSFPFARTFSIGSGNSAETAAFTGVAYCSQCRLAQKRWRIRMKQRKSKRH